MITSITVINSAGESLNIPMGGPNSTGLSIRGIDGLTPPKADINMTEVLGMDGGYYNSSKIQSRNIRITLGFEFSSEETIEEIRLKTYRYFPLGKYLTLQVFTDTRSVYAVGYVETNDPNIFSKDETTVISIVCPDGYLKAIANDITEFTYLTKSFSFPFSNESLTDPLLEFGTGVVSNEKIVNYIGDAPIGFYIEIVATGDVENISIYNVQTNELMFIDTNEIEYLTGDIIVKNDRILISSITGNKYIRLYRDGIEYNILSALQNTQTWFKLQQGENGFVYTATAGTFNMTFEILNSILYQGI